LTVVPVVTLDSTVPSSVSALANKVLARATVVLFLATKFMTRRRVSPVVHPITFLLESLLEDIVTALDTC
jgi:hypothetical protein